jgi:crotonobetainyl-CoA:carnitine CoA-transferase CaiB-like acyl-CoA transferase
MLQSAFLQEYAGSAHTEPRGQDALGTGPLNRAYEAADGWLFLSCRPGDLEQAPDFADLAGLAGPNLERALEFRLRSRSVDAWTAMLTGAGIGAHRIVNDIAELMDDPWVRAHELSVTREHEGFGPITTTGPAPRLWRTPVVVGRPAPRPGSDAQSILADIGMSADLDHLVRDRVVVTEGIVAR